VALDDGWLEAFGRDHVDLVGAGDARVVPRGLALADGTVRELDVLVVTDDPDAGPPAHDDLGLPADHPALFTVAAPGPGDVACRHLEREAERVAAAVTAEMTEVAR
jgi:acetone monooxygenase (methyl acetate-forming)